MHKAKKYNIFQQKREDITICTVICVQITISWKAQSCSVVVVISLIRWLSSL